MMGVFRQGDRVRSTRGGPVMDVKGYDNQNQVICSWYATREGWKQQVFAEKGLRRVRRGRAPKTPTNT